MRCSRRPLPPGIRRFVVFFVVWSIAAILTLPNCRVGADEAASPCRVYHADPQHLWNRLHEALFTRVGPDGRQYGRDRLEPLLWVQTRFLLETRTNDRAVAHLEEFNNARGESLIDDRLKRAMLQRDLWLVFNWIDGNHSIDGDSPLRSRNWATAQARLRDALVTTIRRLSLTADQIRNLPDNYAAAVASGVFAKAYEPESPSNPYLPPDLFAPDGPWVCIGRPDGPVAPAHVQDGSNPFTNSTFLMFLRLPAGRIATLDFLKQIRSFDQPWLVKANERDNGLLSFIPNPNMPQIPAGTEMALVRQALLIDSKHTLVNSPLTESVQLRTYRDVPEITAQNLAAALVTGTGDNRRTRLWQSFQELRLSRTMLFADAAGGLHSVLLDERDFKTGFRAHGWDPFERQDSMEHFLKADQPLIRENCFGCHSLPGLTSFNSFTDGWRTAIRTGEMRPPAMLSDVTVAESLAANVRWKQTRPDWALLRKLLEQ